jgi:hypothetical protein
MRRKRREPRKLPRRPHSGVPGELALDAPLIGTDQGRTFVLYCHWTKRSARITFVMRNVSEFVFNSASRAPDAPAIITAQQTINYRQLRALLINFGLHLRDRGIDRSSRVIIDSDDPIVVLCATLALAMLGCSWVLATKAAIDSDILRTTHLLHDGKKPYQSASRHILVDQNWKQPPSATSKTGFIQ